MSYQRELQNILSDLSSIITRCIVVLKTRGCTAFYHIQSLTQLAEKKEILMMPEEELRSSVDDIVADIIQTFDIATEERDSGIEERSIWIEYKFDSQYFNIQLLKDDMYWHAQNFRYILLDRRNAWLIEKENLDDLTNKYYFVHFWPFLLICLVGMRFAKISEEIRRLKSDRLP